MAKAVPDLAEFDALAWRPPRRPCPVGDALAALKPDERAKLVAALDAGHDRVAPKTIEVWLAGQGLKASWAAVRAHRAGTCACD